MELRNFFGKSTDEIKKIIISEFRATEQTAEKLSHVTIGIVDVPTFQLMYLNKNNIIQDVSLMANTSSNSISYVTSQYKYIILYNIEGDPQLIRYYHFTEEEYFKYFRTDIAKNRDVKIDNILGSD